MEIKEYIELHQQRFLDELCGLLRIPSVSANPGHKKDMKAAAEFLKDRLMDAGVDHAEIMPTKGIPVLYAEKIINTSLPTVMVYGHYDVQPADPVELWNSDPFEPVIKENKIFGRGADDDKGQLYMHVKAFEYLVKTNQLSCNVKFIIEGEEEIGSPSLKEFCKQHKELLKSDIILISDTTMIAQDTPSITVGLRGISYLEVDVTGPNRDLHSGLYGGAVINPVNVLTKMIASLTDNNNSVLIPGFYDDIILVDEEERKQLSRAPFNSETFKKSIDVDEIGGEKGYTTLEHIGLRPSLDVNGIWGGYTGEGAKTIIPSSAHAKISMRLVPNQNSMNIDKIFTEYFKSLAPKGVKVNVRSLHGGEGYLAPLDSKAYHAASKALEKTFGKVPVPIRSGGSIPVVADFEQVLGVKSILMGFGLDSDAIHSPNENFPLYNFYKGIETIPWFYKYFTA
ncbi:MAG: dipeptidase [Bacteroidales bacterium]|nr:dipeptidase [Bacteroidales bacterium]